MLRDRIGEHQLTIYTDGDSQGRQDLGDVPLVLLDDPEGFSTFKIRVIRSPAPPPVGRLLRRSHPLRNIRLSCSPDPASSCSWLILLLDWGGFAQANFKRLGQEERVLAGTVFVVDHIEPRDLSASLHDG